MTTNTHTFLISFIGTTEKFITKPEKLAQLIRENGSQGINYIKLFDSNKEKFIKVADYKIADICSWFTEASIELNKKGFKISSL